MKTKFGLAALDAIQKNYKIILDRLIKGYERVTGKQPEGIDLTMIKREAYEKAEDSAKVVDMEGKTLDPSKPIIGGKQQVDEGFSMTVLDEKGNPTKTVKTTPEGIMDTLQRPFGDNIRDAYKGAGRSREEASEMIEALDSPGAKKSYEIMEESLGVRLYGDETFEELMKIKETGVHPRGEPPIKKAEGGIIGQVQNLINAGLDKGSDLVSGAGKFILNAASPIPFLGTGIAAIQSLGDKTFSNLPIGDQLFITEQMGIQGLDDQSGLAKDKYGYNIRSAFGNYADLVSRRADIARQRELAGQRQRAIDEYYLNLEKERQAAEAEAERRAATAVSQMAAANRAAGTGGFQYGTQGGGGGAGSDFMSGSGTSADMGSFADGGIATMFVERR